jgi:hypothetical protein
MSKYLDQIEARLKAATPGPWLDHMKFSPWPRFVSTKKLEEISVLYTNPNGETGNAAFIAHSRTDCEILLSRLRTAIEALEKLRDGPGNNMVSWRQTWAHEFSSKALQELSAPPSESELG